MAELRSRLTLKDKSIRACPHHHNGVCLRQKKSCQHQDIFFDTCVIFQGNNKLSRFFR